MKFIQILIIFINHDFSTNGKDIMDYFTKG